jgi:Xaa-Pro dipeptidase
LAEKTILQGLIDLGVLQNGTMEEMWEKRVSWYFMPHGLGHYIGIYTHDYQGDQAKENIRKPIPNQSLRVNRVLEAGMCMTNEPGCYVIRGLLAEAKADAEVEKYFNWEVLEEFAKEVQACRIEDDFVITEDGNENYTCYLPRTVAAIEACHAGLEWAHLN